MDLFTNILKNFNCSSCADNEFEDNHHIGNYKNWKLFLKQYELYSAMILYNENLEKDISYLINKNESILLIDSNEEIFIKLEYISNDNGTSILVPTDDYQKLYEKIENMDKIFDKKLDAKYIGIFDIKKCK
jgi:hypothetical protein